MKRLLLAGIVLAIMCGAIWGFGTVIHGSCETTRDLLSEVCGKDGVADENAARRAYEYWDGRSPWLSLIVSEELIENLSEQLLILRAAAGEGRDFDAKLAVESAVAAVDALERNVTKPLRRSPYLS